jgi:hypothetical protein
MAWEIGDRWVTWAHAAMNHFGILLSWEKPGFTICSCRTTVRRFPKHLERWIVIQREQECKAI